MAVDLRVAVRATVDRRPSQVQSSGKGEARAIPATWCLSSLPLLHAALVGLLLAFLVVIVEHAAGQTGSRSDGRSHAGVAGNGPNYRPAGRTPGCSGQRPLLRRRHVTAGGDGERQDRDQSQPFEGPAITHVHLHWFS